MNRESADFMLVGIIYREHSKEAKELAAKTVKFLNNKSIGCCSLASQGPLEGAKQKSEDDWDSGLSLVVVIGGDGTLLRAAQLLNSDKIQVLGVKLGGLGFLTEVQPDELFKIIEDAINGNAPFLERMMLEVRIKVDGKEHKLRALNELTVTYSGMPTVIDLDTRVDGVFVTSFRADGLLISTPTGATAYCMAAGGPIVHPSLKCIILTPICPHTLTSRPLVIPESSRISVTLASNAKEVHITADGQQSWELAPKNHVDITASAKGVRLICSPSMNYYEILRKKLRWGER
jgi:NAD+ kinase